MEIKIRDISQEGLGIGSTSTGHVYFIENTLPGERILAKKISKHEAQVEKYLDVSADRQTPPCPWFPRCGACQLQHMDYQASLRWKHKHVADCLERIAKIDVQHIETCAKNSIARPSPKLWHYRNNSRYQVLAQEGQPPKTGFHQFRSLTLVDQETLGCLLVSPVAEKIRIAFRDFIVKHNVMPSDTPQMLQVRDSETSGDILIVLYFTGKTIDFTLWQTWAKELTPQVSLIVRYGKDFQNSRILAGKNYHIEYLNSIPYQVEYSSFFQINPKQTEQLQNTLVSLVKYSKESAPQNVWDIYGGTGTLGLPFATEGSHVKVFELHQTAEEFGLKQATMQNLSDKFTYVLGDASKTVNAELRSSKKPDLIITDPPRQGLSADLIDTLLSIGAPTWAYVSCDPASLARDLKKILAGGYRLEAWEAFDMFPWTSHVETLALMLRA